MPLSPMAGRTRAHRHMEAYEGRTIDWERLEKSPVWKQGYFEGAEKLQSLMLRTQRYMDASATRGNVVLRPHQKAAVGGIVAGKQLDQLNRVYGTNFNTFSFSGGGGSYTYSLTSASTLSTKIGFSISFKDMFGFQVRCVVERAAGLTGIGTLPMPTSGGVLVRVTH